MYPISAIFIYPIKSMGGIQLSHAKLTQRGLKYDRRFMLVRPDGSFITQRETPKMALFSLKINEKGIKVTFNVESIQLPFDGETWEEKLHDVDIWKDNVKAKFAPNNINAWFSDKIQENCYLSYMPDISKRSLDPIYAGPNQVVSFADGYPFLLCNNTSMDYLNKNMALDIDIDRFRANIVFKGKHAWEEDDWASFTIGSAQFKCAKPCARCVVVNTDQVTAERGTAVLKTLARFRRAGKKVLFGINLVWVNFDEGQIEIAVGDQMHVNLK